MATEDVKHIETWKEFISKQEEKVEGINQDADELIWRMSREGLSVAQISKVLGCEEAAVVRSLARMGLVTVRRCRIATA